ncbi:MAG TPA: MBL fold metallo-hydrolase [Myxococcales bacterium]|nr:MBL fold metallo-hydrolase [Myxococcales bacterium]
MKRVVALGSADAFSSAARGNTCWLIEDGAPLCVVDFGPTALLAMRRLGRDPQELQAVHITHLHGDHIAGWPFLLVDAVYRARRTAPLTVAGPLGTRDRLQALWAASYADAAAKELPFPLEVRELLPGDTAEVCGRRIEALGAFHQRPPHVALSLRVHGPAGILAFTGDTGPHAGLTSLARGARLLCSECTELRTPASAASGASPDYPAEAGRRHLSWDDLRSLLPTLGVPLVALGHLGSEVRAAAESIEAEARALGLNLRVCDDLSAIDLGR